jgi:hypothetical protein
MKKLSIFILPWRKNVMEHHRLIFVKPYESFSKKAQLKVGLLGKSRQGRKFRQDFSGRIALKNAHLNRLALILNQICSVLSKEGQEYIACLWLLQKMTEI